MDQRDKEAKNTTRTQLWFAVGSLFISTIFAGASVCQDYQNNKASDRWQSTILNEIQTLNVKKKNDYKEEIRIIKEENKNLTNRIVVLESELKDLHKY